MMKLAKILFLAASALLLVKAASAGDIEAMVDITGSEAQNDYDSASNGDVGPCEVTITVTSYGTGTAAGTFQANSKLPISYGASGNDSDGANFAHGGGAVSIWTEAWIWGGAPSSAFGYVFVSW